jgi:hypothetical protein
MSSHEVEATHLDRYIWSHSLNNLISSHTNIVAPQPLYNPLTPSLMYMSLIPDHIPNLSPDRLLAVSCCTCIERIVLTKSNG